MRNLFRYLNGGLIGMILEYLYRVDFNVWPLIVCIALIIGMIMDLYPQKKIWIHKTGRWYHYWKPTWLNTISRKPGDPKIYRWLFWGYEQSPLTIDNGWTVPTVNRYGRTPDEQELHDWLEDNPR